MYQQCLKFRLFKISAVRETAYSRSTLFRDSRLNEIEYGKEIGTGIDDVEETGMSSLMGKKLLQRIS
jgi:hypothetical protein